MYVNTMGRRTNVDVDECIGNKKNNEWNYHNKDQFIYIHPMWTTTILDVKIEGNEIASYIGQILPVEFLTKSAV